MVEKNDLSELELDELFADAAAKPVVVPADLMQRIEAEANLVADARAVSPVAPTRPGRIAGLLAAIGGWPAMAGLATATVAGVWIGFSPPDSIDSLTSGYLANTTYYDVGDFMPSFDDILNEG